MKASEFDISLLSPHLFWDVVEKQINVKNDFPFIVKRVLEYGLMNDWILLSNYFSIEEIADAAKQLRDLDSKSLSYISLLSGEPLENFRCYTIRQSIPPHWSS